MVEITNISIILCPRSSICLDMTALKSSWKQHEQCESLELNIFQSLNNLRVSNSFGVLTEVSFRICRISSAGSNISLKRVRCMADLILLVIEERAATYKPEGTPVCQ